MTAANLHSEQTPPDASRISVLVVDDHPVLRYGVASLLKAEQDFDVVGSARNCAEACRLVDEQRPDIVLLDLEMDDTEGVDAVSRLRDHQPAKVIIYTAHKDDQRILEAIRIGINGYVMKGAPNSRLCEAIRIVARGGMYLDADVAPKITALLSAHQQSQKPAPDSLTRRECEVLNCVAAGKRNKEIAKELFISERTVKFHASSVFAKLGASNRTEAVRIAVSKNLISL